MLKPTLANAAFPDYSLHLDPETDKVHFFNRNTMPLDSDIEAARARNSADRILHRLSPDIGEKARKSCRAINYPLIIHVRQTIV